MMTVLAILTFGGALAVAGFAIAATVAPEFGRIVDTLYGRQQPRFEPLAALVRAERRIAVRRWAGAGASARPTSRMREAA